MERNAGAFVVSSDSNVSLVVTKVNASNVVISTQTARSSRFGPGSASTRRKCTCCPPPWKPRPTRTSPADSSCSDGRDATSGRDGQRGSPCVDLVQSARPIGAWVRATGAGRIRGRGLAPTDGRSPRRGVGTCSKVAYRRRIGVMIKGWAGSWEKPPSRSGVIPTLKLFWPMT
jgi:hypothetical protein